MDTVRINDRKNCRIIAHRGLSGIECENSMPAFIAAGNRSYFGIETDVHVTSDGKYIIIHDDTTGRVAAGNDHPVEETDYETLRGIMLADRGGLTGRTDLRLPSLDEYLLVCERYGKTSVLELKNHMLPEHVAGIVSAARASGHLEKTVFISFDLDNMIELRRLLPEHRLQFLTGGCDAHTLERLKRYRLDLDIYYPSLTKEIVDEVHANGLEVNCWTCDNAADAERLIGMGVDYITTNILE